MVIDFHTHVFPDKIAERTVKALEDVGGIPSFGNGMRKGLSESLAKAGVDLAVNLPVLTKPSQFDSVLEFAKEINRERYEMGGAILSFAGAHPAMDGIEEKLAEAREAGILGIKVHPDYQGTFFDDEGYVRIIKAAKALDLIVVTHAGVDVAYLNEPVKCTPTRVLRVLDRIGGYSKLVLAHYGASKMFDEVYSTLAGEDVYFDTAYVLGSIEKDTFEKILGKHGADRILFATDSPWQDISLNLERIRSFGLDPNDEEKILFGNAAQLLGISKI